MEPYAVIQTGGRQYMVKANETLEVNLMDAEKGSTIDIRPVLALSDGKQLQVGKPEVAGVSVKALVVDHIRGDKVVSFKKYRRKGYSRKRGHRQELTVLKIQAIS
mgnify:CR=1 FL=1